MCSLLRCTHCGEVNLVASGEKLERPAFNCKHCSKHNLARKSFDVAIAEMQTQQQRGKVLQLVNSGIGLATLAIVLYLLLGPGYH